MATAREIIIGAMQQIGALAASESLSAADAQLGLTSFQDQLDAWAADRLAIARNERNTFTLTSGTSTVTIGLGTPNGDVAIVRPVWFTAVNYVVPGTSPAVEVPMGQMDDDSYANLSIKSLTSSLPTQYYYNATVPLGTLFFWPTVTQNVTIALYSPVPVAQPAALTDTVIGPPGYADAFKYQLAIRLSVPFGRTVSALLMELATKAYATMTRPNNIPGLLGVDAGLVPRSGGAYNILSDGYTGSGR